MNKKNGLICLFVLVILFQIAVPIGFIAYRNSLAERNTEQEILEKGTDYKFRVRIQYISDNCIHYTFDYTQARLDSEQNDYLYAQIYTDEFGCSTFQGSNFHRKDDAYICLNYRERNAFPYESVLPTASTLSYSTSVSGTPSEDPMQNTSFYLLVRIYQGESVILGMLDKDNRPVDEWLNENQAMIEDYLEECIRQRELGRQKARAEANNTV